MIRLTGIKHDQPGDSSFNGCSDLFPRSVARQYPSNTAPEHGAPLDRSTMNKQDYRRATRRLIEQLLDMWVVSTLDLSNYHIRVRIRENSVQGVGSVRIFVNH